MSYNVLHITDLHIENIAPGSGEYLREDFYQEYLSKFAEEILKISSKIDALILTGDFVHRGDFKNFAHATKVVDFLKNKLSLKDQQIGVCAGNHDIDRKLDFSGQPTEARAGYNAFKVPYLDSFDLAGYTRLDRVQYKLISDEVLFISLDSTLNRSHKMDKPGKIENNELDVICKDIRKIDENDNIKLVLIASHYPLEYVECPEVPAGGDWYDKHFWLSGENLKRRINGILKDTKVIWLSGDIHSPSFTQKDNNLYVVSGRFGTNSELYAKEGSDTIKVEQISYINRQACLIRINENHLADVYLINQVQTKHGYDPNSALWRHYNIHNYPLLNQPANISSKLDNLLKNFITENKLFDYKKVVLDNMHNQVSLGWVMVDGLFSDKQNFAYTAREISLWLKDKLSSNLTMEETLFVGCDFWGSIFVSHLSVVLGISNICVPSKGNIKSWSDNEHVDGAPEKFIKQLKGKKRIVLLADVVATGRSIKKVYEKISALSTESPKFYCISLICDVRQEKKENLSEIFEAFGTCCSSFRLPMFTKSQLPEISLISEKIMYRTDYQ